MQQQEILTQFGVKVLDRVPDGWSRITYFRESVIEHSTALLEVEYEDGSTSRESPVGLGLMLDDLRAGMYQEGKGTWFSMKYVITPPGKFNVDFNYDEDPGLTFPTPMGYTVDLKYFPRDEEHIPDWLREKLQEEADGRGAE
ncbi:antitoxin YezG family protein [Nocardiopsis sp. FIRDI 009]|uniref:antitoxin YezG family protein n=1 Tax=Nocardiopsis sp. FIRDI 009 TaxID=714197 RepID=UPI001E59C8F6|nr:antitoxin YezG family protein [Nocardiopsis sp. FIRDI 009]